MEISEDRFIECMAIDFPNFKISKSNITHPTSHFVITFYSLILRNVIELNDPDEVWNITEDQKSYINSYHPEAATFGQHVWIYNFHSAIKYVFNHLSENGSEFVYSDILFPENTPRRSFVFMALLLNFYWYTNDLALELDPDLTACLDKAGDIQNLKNEKEKNLSLLRELEFQRCQYVELYKDKKKMVLKNTEVNQEKELIIKELLADEETIQKKCEKIQEERENLQEILLKFQNEKNYYQSLIVSNENHVKDIHEKHIKEKDECVKKMKNLENQVKTTSNALAKCKKIFEILQKFNTVLKDDKSSQDLQGKHKGFQSLYNSIAAVMEKKKRLSEEALTPEQQISQAEEALAKLECDSSVLEAESGTIMMEGKKRVEASKKISNENKQKQSVRFSEMRKESEKVDEIVAYTADLTSKQIKLEKSIASHDSRNKTAYITYIKDMQNVFDLLDTIFGDQLKDQFGIHSILLNNSSK